MKKLDGVSDVAVRKATGCGWDEWLALLDEAGAAQWDHKQIVAFLTDRFGLSGWWQQTVTVAYEKARGRRVIGQTADSGFQLGVQKTVPIPHEAAWQLLTSRPGIRCWLGDAARFKLIEGQRYTTGNGTSGEVRVVKPRQRVRMTWKEPGMNRPATLQITLAKSAPGKTAVRVHLEHLASQAARQQMKSHWQDVLAEFTRLAENTKQR